VVSLLEVARETVDDLDLGRTFRKELPILRRDLGSSVTALVFGPLFSMDGPAHQAPLP